MKRCIRLLCWGLLLRMTIAKKEKKGLTKVRIWDIIYFVLCESRTAGYGELAEWSKAHDWKSCRRDERLQGSNP